MALINVILELEKCGRDWQYASEEEIKTLCPFHPDTSPSCSVNVKTLLFKCHAASCGQSGDVISLLAGILKQPRGLVREMLAQRYDLDDVKTIEPKVIEDAHANVWAAKPLLQELYARGVTDEDIRKYRFGEKKGRITIPVKNQAGSFVNVRYYLPGAPGADKMRNTRGRSQPRLFPIEQLKYDTVVLCGGEMKAVVSARLCNPRGYGALCVTGAEGSWHHSLAPLFAGKRIYIMMDIDAGGKKAAARYAAILNPVASWLGIVELPLDPDKYPTGDVNDFVARENGNLLSVLDQTARWVSPLQERIADDAEPRAVKFSEAVQSDNVGQRMKFSATVCATNETSFVVPKRVFVDCQKNQDCCAVCAVFPREDRNYFISPESPAVLEMVGVSKEHLDKAVRNAIGVPRKCDSVTFDVKAHFNAEDVRINPSLEITNRDTDRSMQPALCVSCDAELNNSYEFTGRLYPHPRTQQATLLIAQSATTQDALSSYQPKDLWRFRMFRPESWTVESIDKRLNELYDDLEANVTRIYMRRDMHAVVDLAYHSVLLFKLDGKTIKGWAEVVLVGDAGHGKTEVVTNIMQHYGLGEMVGCKNASVPGLLGGVQQMGTEWFVSWGVLPTQDKRLVVLEELKGASRDVLAKLTDMRSSGVAEITKIKKRRTHARTRIIAVSNPRDERNMSSYSYGIEAVRDLIGAPEDVRRFDIAMAVAANDIDDTALAKLVRHPPKVKHEHTAELCRELVLWAWTRTVDQVQFHPETADALMDCSQELSKNFSDLIPLVDKSSTRSKLARLAASLACRTFSTGNDEQTVLVRGCHVHHVTATLRRLYDSPSMGYGAFSKASEITSAMTDPEVIGQAIRGCTYPVEMRDQLLYCDKMDVADLQDWLGGDRMEAQTFLSLLVRKRAVRRDNRQYRKTPEFIDFLKALEVQPARPEFNREEKF